MSLPLLALQLEPSILLLLDSAGPVLVDDARAAYPGVNFDDQLQPYRSTRVFTWRSLVASFWAWERNDEIRFTLAQAIRSMDKHMDGHGLTRVLAFEGAGIVPELVGV